MIFTKKIIQLSKNDRKIAGGKSIYLGEIMKMGILVPKGFVVLAPAFDKFLEQNNLDKKIKKLLSKINSNKQSINKISKEICNLIAKTDIPEDVATQISKEFLRLKKNYVAVRSSAIFEDSLISSWAGELESYLNTTKTDLLNNLKKCWASVFSPKAIYYKFDDVLKNKHNFSIAVIVQEMIRSEISGICFTVHPVAADYNKMVIEAGFGLGEIITKGVITPDTYIIDKKNKLILDRHIGQLKQKMTNAQIFKLSEICRKIEKRYKAPQDIEWAFAKNKFYILQSRPVTTL